jgi:hypothetical protein
MSGQKILQPFNSLPFDREGITDPPLQFRREKNGTEEIDGPENQNRLAAQAGQCNRLSDCKWEKMPDVRIAEAW